MQSATRYIHFVVTGLGLLGLFLLLKWFLESALNVLLLATPLTACALMLVKMLYVENVLGEPADIQGAEKNEE